MFLSVFKKSAKPSESALCGKFNKPAIQQAMGLTAFEVKITGEWAAALDSVAREVWNLQGQSITPAFVRMVFEQIVQPLIAVRLGAVKHEFPSRTVFPYKSLKPAGLLYACDDASTVRPPAKV
jgi:hypothetical protein